MPRRDICTRTMSALIELAPLPFMSDTQRTPIAAEFLFAIHHCCGHAVCRIYPDPTDDALFAWFNQLESYHETLSLTGLRLLQLAYVSSVARLLFTTMCQVNPSPLYLLGGPLSKAHSSRSCPKDLPSQILEMAEKYPAINTHKKFIIVSITQDCL